jgi:AcrR family transcriptional regulator
MAEAATPETAETRVRSGLRERTKARTRQELIDAAFTLFAERGFEACTVDEIAEAADVSPRTFFRYFPVKEDVALARLEDESALIVEHLARRPASESPLTALREALREPLDRLKGEQQLCGIMKMVESCPSLVARQMALRADKEERLAVVLAARMGVDAAADPRPRLIATTFMAAVGQAYRTWIEDGMPDDLDARIDALTELLRGGLEG